MFWCGFVHVGVWVYSWDVGVLVRVCVDVDVIICLQIFPSSVLIRDITVCICEVLCDGGLFCECLLWE